MPPILCFGGTTLQTVGANYIPTPGVPCGPQFSPPATGTRAGPSGAGWPAQGCCGWTRGGWLRLVTPGVCVRQGCSDPSARCAVAVEIACAVARQLKHPRSHTAMPRNSQLSSFPSPVFDFADMTPLALIPLHSVALLRFLGVNPINPKKPAWHCK